MAAIDVVNVAAYVDASIDLAQDFQNYTNDQTSQNCPSGSGSCQRASGHCFGHGSAPSSSDRPETTGFAW